MQSVLDDLNQEKYREGEKELQVARKRRQNPTSRIKRFIAHLRLHGRPTDANWD